MTLDFVLDPEIGVKGSVLQNVFDCDCSRTSTQEFVQFLWGAHLEVFFILIVILGFLLLLFQRRGKFKFPTSRQLAGSRKPVEV